MHSSYALSSDDFSVERGDSVSTLGDLWPGGWQPEDRLGVMLANPMDGVGCSNLICATTTLFYDHLRETKGTGNFFRYADNLPDRRRLRARRLQPARRVAAAQVRDDHPADRRGADRGDQRSPHHAAGDARDRRPLPRRGRALDLEHLPRAVRSVVTYSARTGRARDADVSLVGNRVVESYVEQAIFSTPGIDAGLQARLRRLRRNLDREPRSSRSSSTARSPTRRRCPGAARASPWCFRRAIRSSPAGPRRP